MAAAIAPAPPTQTNPTTTTLITAMPHTEASSLDDIWPGLRRLDFLVNSAAQAKLAWSGPSGNRAQDRYPDARPGTSPYARKYGCVSCATATASIRFGGALSPSDAFSVFADDGPLSIRAMLSGEPLRLPGPKRLSFVDSSERHRRRDAGYDLPANVKVIVVDHRLDGSHDAYLSQIDRNDIGHVPPEKGRLVGLRQRPFVQTGFNDTALVGEGDHPQARKPAASHRA